MSEILVRFVVGGFVVAAFALLGDLFKPKSFAGLFGGAPSVALATLALTVKSNGPDYAATEARSMIAGAIAFFLYASLVSRVLMHRKLTAAWVTAACFPVWAGVAFGLWWLWLRN